MTQTASARAPALCPRVPRVLWQPQAPAASPRRARILRVGGATLLFMPWARRQLTLTTRLPGSGTAALMLPLAAPPRPLLTTPRAAHKAAH